MVQQPSPIDSALWIAALQEHEQYLQSIIAGKDHAFHLGPPQPNFELQVERARLAKAIAFPRLFGSVLCTSGLLTYRHAENQALQSHLDWALVEVDASRLPIGLLSVTNASFMFPIPNGQARTY